MWSEIYTPEIWNSLTDIFFPPINIYKNLFRPQQMEDICSSKCFSNLLM